MNTPPIGQIIQKLAADFETAFGYRPVYVYLGGKFLSQAFREYGGRPLVAERLIVQAVKWDELGVGAEKLSEDYR